MIEVIEHLTHPRETIQAIERILKPGGILFILTGNVSHAFNPFRRIASTIKRNLTGLRTTNDLIHEFKNAFHPLTWDYFSLEGHVSYFSPKTLGRLYRNFNLQPVYISPWSLSGLNLPVGMKPSK